MVPVEYQLTGVVPPEERASPDSTGGQDWGSAGPGTHGQSLPLQVEA